MSQSIFKKGMYFRRSDGALFIKRGSVYLSRRYPLRSTENRLLEIPSIENPEDYTIIKKIQYNQMMNNLFSKLLRGYLLDKYTEPRLTNKAPSLRLKYIPFLNIL